MKDMKNLAFLVFFAMIVFTMLVVSKYLDNERDKYYVEKGLEQCIDDPDGKISRIIWVKDCDKYVITIRGEK